MESKKRARFAHFKANKKKFKKKEHEVYVEEQSNKALPSFTVFNPTQVCIILNYFTVLINKLYLMSFFF